VRYEWLAGVSRLTLASAAAHTALQRRRLHAVLDSDDLALGLLRKPLKEAARVRPIDVSKLFFREAQSAETPNCRPDGGRRGERKVRPEQNLFGRDQLEEWAKRGHIGGPRSVVMELPQLVDPTLLSHGAGLPVHAIDEEGYRAARMRENEPDIGPSVKGVAGQETDKSSAWCCAGTQSLRTGCQAERPNRSCTCRGGHAR
jgi:hypothetical protein